MTKESRITLIVIGLPANIRRRIDKDDIEDIESLINDLSKFGTSFKYKKWDTAGEKYDKKQQLRKTVRDKCR